uniref:Uncharacterized protein n=1 Tax=Lactuca sativa TaxID=4236 RepID=A0A9R1UYD5_LACSA|nr:hypothetical protein LSAT_V11C700380550 [Lactuca sativa]
MLIGWLGFTRTCNCGFGLALRATLLTVKMSFSCDSSLSHANSVVVMTLFLVVLPDVPGQLFSCLKAILIGCFLWLENVIFIKYGFEERVNDNGLVSPPLSMLMI